MSFFGVSGLFGRFYSILMEQILLAKSVDPDQTSHYVAPDWVCTVCLWPFYGFPGKNGL